VENKAAMTTDINPVQPSRSFYTFSWKWMRLTAFLLIPLVWIHAIIQALITGGQNLSLEYVQMRWMFLGWRIYDIFLLAFAFSHGISGLRQVLFDFIKPARWRTATSWILLAFWLLIIFIGAIAIIGGVRMSE
jgi:succinate dehydrogenase / fumarate reductase membrane anchor subunit